MNKTYEKKLLAMIALASKNGKVLRALLQELLTPKEYIEVVTRFEILSRLQTGEAQRLIATSLGLGIATVTRGSHELTKGAKVFKKFNPAK
jgi:TrpR family trp operon transcriptional repressor